MGLDAVEIVLRTEEVFAITIDNSDASYATSVGKLYELVCTGLGLPPSATPPAGAGIAHSLVVAGGLIMGWRVARSRGAPFMTAGGPIMGRRVAQSWGGGWPNHGAAGGPITGCPVHDAHFAA